MTSRDENAGNTARFCVEQRCSDSSFCESDSSPDPRDRNPDPDLNPVCNRNVKSESEKILLICLTNQCATIKNFCF